MSFFKITQYTQDNVSGIRLGFLWIFSFTITHNENNGKHLSLGLGASPLEFSLQLSLWRLV
jgi:hypothetical protein